MESPTPTFQPVGMRPQNYACIIYCKNHLILVVSINFLRSVLQRMRCMSWFYNIPHRIHVLAVCLSYHDLSLSVR